MAKTDESEAKVVSLVEFLLGGDDFDRRISEWERAQARGRWRRLTFNHTQP